MDTSDVDRMVDSREQSPTVSTGRRSASLERDCSGSRLKGVRSYSPSSVEFNPEKRRARTAEMNMGIISTAQQADKDKDLFSFLGGAPILKMQDPRNPGRQTVLVARAASQVALARPRRSGAAAREELVDDTRVATTIELDPTRGGLTLAGLDAIRKHLLEPRAALAARYIGVGRKYASATLGAWQRTGTVPAAVADLRGRDRGGGQAAVASLFTRAQLQKIRMWIIGEARAGRNVFSKPLRAQIHDLTGVSLNRRKLQAIREPLGIVFSKVVGAGGAKMSRRVRLQRFRFVARRMEEDAREPSKRPMRVYSDESYCNANTAANNTWVLSERVWEETILQDAIEKIATGDTVEMPTNMVGSMCHAGAQLSKPKSGKGGRAVIINALYALPADLSDDEKACIDGDVVMGGPVDGVLTIWAASSSTGDYHGNFTNSIYLHWLDSKLIPALIKLSKKNAWRPVTFIIDGASYHTATRPSALEFASLTRGECLELCELFGVTEAQVAHLPVHKQQKGPEVGANVELHHLRSFLQLLMPPQRSRAQVLWAQRLKQAKVPDWELWVLDEEPAYHYELQATEEGWGVVKKDIAMHPVYSLKGMMTALKLSFETLWTEQLCCSLVRRCRDHEARFWYDDYKVFGVGGLDEDVKCSFEFCTINDQMSAATAKGEQARAVEVRRCMGVCGGDAFHQQCLTHGRRLNAQEIENVWPASKSVCRCGCSDELASDSDDEEETEELGEDEKTLAKVKQHMAIALAAQRASNAAATKAKPPGASSSLER